MRSVLIVLISLHGLIHVLGFLKAFELARLPQLRLPISTALGVLWLSAAILILASMAAWLTWPRGWWLIGAVAVVSSQSAILSSWSDAKFGTWPNLLLLGLVVYGCATQGPGSFRARFDAESTASQAEDRTAQSEAAATALRLEERDLLALPPPVQRYLRATGFVGQPRVASYRLRFRGRIRGTPNDAWLSFDAEQRSVVQPATRLFLMSAQMKGLPVQAFHRFVAASASMQVKLAGLFSMVDQKGPELSRAETVTVFNDMCLLAPGALVSPAVQWVDWDEHRAHARFTSGAHTIAATLEFDDDGLLRNFVSDDRSRTSADGRTLTRLRFSTPVRDYKPYGPYRLASLGEARWHAPPPEGTFTYGEFELVEAQFDEAASSAR